MAHIEDCTEQWQHRAESNIGLTEYLGLTREEHETFLRHGREALGVLLEPQRRSQRFVLYQLELDERKAIPFAFKGMEAVKKAGYEQPPAAQYRMVWTGEIYCPNQKAEMRIEPKGNDAPAQDEAPDYTQNTPVEELLQVMTLEQARQVVVDDGICRGMTIAQVAEKRPVNLRFYLIPGKSKNNLVRAAAQLVLDSLQKAG